MSEAAIIKLTNVNKNGQEVEADITYDIDIGGDHDGVDTRIATGD